MVVIDNEYEVATEAGFTGERRIYTWRDRIKQLEKLNFIDVRPGPKGPFQFIIIFNPYNVLYEIHEAGKMQEHYWMALIERSEEIGAKDLLAYREFLTTASKIKKTNSKTSKK